jgi:UDP-glucose 4-epimerase|tara:strand:+ start:645 stop:1631 length:987 start_codon:yes stop_codon:yes gene_type:complete
VKILITGIGGLIGCHLADYLIQQGNKVIGIDDLSGGYLDNVPEQATFYKLNLQNSEAVDLIFKNEKPNIVFHFAAYAAEGLSRYIKKYNYENNVLSSVSIINSCIKHSVDKLIFSSSMAVYGGQKTPFTEDMRPMPEDSYGIAKYTVEQDLKDSYDHFGLNYIIVRPHNVFGPKQNIWDKYRNVIGIWMRQALNGKPLTIFGDGQQTRAFSNIKYYMQPFEKIITEYNDEIFNIGADKYYKIIDVANIVLETSAKHGFPTSIQHLEARNEVKHAFCDHKKAKEMLNFKDETNLEKLIDEMFIWAKSQPNRDVKYMDYELTKNLYSFWK